MTEASVTSQQNKPKTPRRRLEFAADWKTSLLRYSVSIIILLTGAGICYWLSLQKEQPEEQSTEQLTPLVSVASAVAYYGQIDLEVSGTVEPFREVRVAAKVTGNVISKSEFCRAGNFVDAGTPLIEIDPADYANQLTIARAELEQSEKSLAENKLEIGGAQDAVTLAEQDLEIARSEFERSKKIRSALAKSEFDQARRTFLVSQGEVTNRRNNLTLIRSRIERLQAAIELSQARVEAAEVNLSRATVVAPDDGIIVEEFVQQGDFVTTGSPLFTFEDTRQAQVICYLSPRDIDWIRTNSKLSDELKESIEQNRALAAYYLPKSDVTIFEPEQRSVIWSGSLERFDGIGRDAASRTIPTRITVADPVAKVGQSFRALVRGMYVKCLIQVQISAGDVGPQFLSFPATALRPGGYVWAVVDNQLSRVDVEIVDRVEKRVNDAAVKMVVIRVDEDSLQVNDTIVVSPIPQATGGLEVQLQPLEDKDVDPSILPPTLDPKT